VTKIHDHGLANSRLKIREIAETVGISNDRVGHILHEILGMRKLSPRCVLFKRNPREFLRRFVTVDETWIHWYTPETKKQSKLWNSPGKPAPKKARTVPSARKVMVTVFWDSQGVIYIDYLEKGKTFTGLY